MQITISNALFISIQEYVKLQFYDKKKFPSSVEQVFKQVSTAQSKHEPGFQDQLSSVCWKRDYHGVVATYLAPPSMQLASYAIQTSLFQAPLQLPDNKKIIELLKVYLKESRIYLKKNIFKNRKRLKTGFLNETNSKRWSLIILMLFGGGGGGGEKLNQSP